MYELVPVDTSKGEQHQPWIAQPGRSSQAFPDLDSQTLKRRRVVCLKFTPALDWRRRSTPHQPASMAPGAWNGNDNEWAFPMVGVLAYFSVRETELTRDGCAECLPM